MSRASNRRKGRPLAIGSGRVPANIVAEVASTGDGRDITQPWVGELRQPRDPRLLSSVDWGVYKRILMDDQVKSTFEQRIRAVVSRDWEVRSGDDKDTRATQAAELMTDNLQAIGIDRVTEKMLYANFNGYSVAELIWAPIGGFVQWSAIKVRHARRFREDKDGRLRLLTLRQMQGEIVPDRKFWKVTAGGTDDDEPYGHGLADWLYWPTLFKRNGIRFWNIFLDKYGTPTAKGTYRRGTPQADIDKLLAALQAIATDSGFVIPEGMAVELLTAANSGTGDFEKLCRYMDEAIAKVVLSQTMTTSDGSSRSQAEVHAGVKLEVVQADADLLSDSFNAGPSRWWTDLNFGPDVAQPQLVRILDEEADTAKEAETDEKLSRLGWVRTEESFKDTYGDDYERKPEPAAAAIGADGKPVLAPDLPVVDDKNGDGADEEEPGNVVPIRSGTASFAELIRARDTIDGAVEELLQRDGWEALAPIVAPIADAVAKSGSAEELDENLIASLQQSDVDRLTTAIARAGFAVRVAAETGADDASGSPL